MLRDIARRHTDGGLPQFAIEAATFRFRQPSCAASTADPAGDDENDAAAAGADGRGCAVCLAGLQGGDECRRLPCLHAFHVACIDDWLSRSRACPVCKENVAVAAVKRV